MFGWTRIATFAAVAAAVAMATGVAGATSKPGGAATAGSSSHMPSAGKITTAAAHRAALLNAANLRTRAGAARYLRAIGVNPHHFDIQRGIRNYAGAKCPGAGWSCTSTAHPVIQIASAGGSNTFQCTTANCAVVQVSAPAAKPNPNPGTAVCIKTTGLNQSCSISQTSSTANNLAIVYEKTAKMSGLTQTASATAQITQKATSSGVNTACVYQDINIDGSNGIAKKGTPVAVTLNAHQSISITQDSATGGNTVQNATLTGTTGGCDSSALTQNQTLTSNATGSSSVVQSENATDSGPNVSLDIKQNQSPGFLGNLSVSGANIARFSQKNSLTAVAITPNGPVSQTQSSANGGLLATVNQFSHDATNTSTIEATQIEEQCEHAQATGSPSCSLTAPMSAPAAYTPTQVQYGPLRKGDGTSTQGDNPGDTFTVSQSSTQNRDNEGQGVQQNTVQGDCSTSGNCTVTQDTNVDGSQQHNVQTGQNVSTQTTCSENDCTSSGGFFISPTGLSVSNTDVGEFGVGGMRGGNGTGSILASGIAGPVTHAFLFWNGPTNSTDLAANAAVTFNGSPVTGTNIGVASDNNWSFANTQSYRADVTPLVTGNGTYSLGDFTKLPDVDINGVSLIVFYNDGDPSNDRNVVAWNGNDSNVTTGPPYSSDPWDETITGVSYPGSGAASLDLVVADGQSIFPDGALVLNDQTLAPAGDNFSGDSTPPNTAGSLWDVKPFDITSFLEPGPNTLHLTSDVNQDYLSLVVAIANVPTNAPVIP
jgi:hypothetical protein